MRLETARDLKRIMFEYYIGTFQARQEGRRVAWITSGGPVEILYALGVTPVYPENYGAVCGSQKVAVELCQAAEARGYSQDLCSYARANIGSMLTGQGPMGGLPAPDFLVVAKNLCGVLLKWWEVAARHYGVPLFVLDVPFVTGEAGNHVVPPNQRRYIRRQFEEYVAFAERQAGRELTPELLLPVLERAGRAVGAWTEIQGLRRYRPCPVGAVDMFTCMFPIVTLRGSEVCAAFMERLAAEVRSRVEAGIGAAEEERFRLVWDNIAIWYNFELFLQLQRRGAVFVAETYTDAWAQYRFDLADPLGSMAERYTDVLLNIGFDLRLERMTRMIEGCRADGVVFHSCRSCKTYSLGQLFLAREIERRLRIPCLILEADMADNRAFAAGQAATRLDAFLEVLAGRVG